jgi:hypothetical protein
LLVDTASREKGGHQTLSAINPCAKTRTTDYLKGNGVLSEAKNGEPRK